MTEVLGKAERKLPVVCKKQATIMTVLFLLSYSTLLSLSLSFLFLCLSVCLSIYLFVWFPLPLFLYLYIYIYIYIYLSFFLSFFQPLSLSPSTYLAFSISLFSPTYSLSISFMLFRYRMLPHPSCLLARCTIMCSGPFLLMTLS